MCDVRIDSIVRVVTVTRIAAAAIEAQAEKIFRFVVAITFPRARSNDTIGKDATKGNARAIVNESVGGGLRGHLLKKVGLGVFQLEEQKEGIMAWQFSPKEYRRLLKNLWNVGQGREEITQMVPPRSCRNAAEGQW